MRILRHSLLIADTKPMAKGGPPLRLLSRSAGGKAASRLPSGAADASHQEITDSPADLLDLRRTVRSHRVSGMPGHTHQHGVRNVRRRFDRILDGIVEVQFGN